MLAVPRIARTALRVVIAQQDGSGLALSMRAAAAGHHVIGLDLAHHGALLALARPEPARMRGFDVAVITVAAPVRARTIDRSAIVHAARTLAPALQPGATVVLESVTSPGTTQGLLVPLLEAGSGLAAGADFFVGYSPGSSDPEQDTWPYRRHPRVVAGIDPGSLAALEAFYGTLVERMLPVVSPREVELGRLLAAQPARGRPSSRRPAPQRWRRRHHGIDRCAEERRRGRGRRDGRS